MNQVTPESKSTVTKIMAIIGFVAVILFGVWLAVQVVGIIPGAFSSLASIADGIYNNRPTGELTVVAENSVVNIDETFAISWSDLNRIGTYQFSYACVNGVAIDVIDPNGQTIPVECDTYLSLGNETLSLSLSISSEKRRFVDIPYTVTFVDIDDAETSYEANGTVTAINADIPASDDLASDSEGNVSDAEAAAEETTVTDGSEATDTAPENATTPGPTIIEEQILTIPVSDPSGFTDLAVKFLGVGTLNNNNEFALAPELIDGVRGAFQFEVKNIGTKTSTEWNFEATLPSGAIFNSQTQIELKPNERAVITLGFDAVGDAGTNRFGAVVSGGDDSKTSNNSFIWAVNVVE